MVEQVDMEHISLHRYIRNTPSDTEVHAEQQLGADRRTWPVEASKQPCKFAGQSHYGETGVWVGLDPPQRVGGPQQGSYPHSGAVVAGRGATLKAECEPADLRQLAQNEDQTALAAAVQTAGRGGGWELESGDCGAIPGRGLLWTAERRIKGMCGRTSWWEMPVEESQAALEARWCCESRVGCGPVTVASLPTRRHRRLNGREAGPANAWPRNYRTPPGCPLKGLMSQSTEQEPIQAPL